MDEDALAEELRRSIGELVRAVRAVDTMPPAKPPSSDSSTATAP